MKFPHCVTHNEFYNESKFLTFPHCVKNSLLIVLFSQILTCMNGFLQISHFFLYRIVQQEQETFDHYFHANQQEDETGENVNILNLENDWEELENDVDELATQIQVPKFKQSFT